MKVTPLRDKIYFQFCDDVTNVSFQSKSKSGIILTDVYDYNEVKYPKWGKILKCGNEVCDQIKQAIYILIESGKWTTRISYDEQIFWSTEESFILATTDDISETVRY